LPYLSGRRQNELLLEQRSGNCCNANRAKSGFSGPLRPSNRLGKTKILLGRGGLNIRRMRLERIGALTGPIWGRRKECKNLRAQRVSSWNVEMKCPPNSPQFVHLH